MSLSRQIHGNMAGLKFRQHAWRTYWQCGGGDSRRGPDPSKAYGEKMTWICLSMLLPQRQRNFAGHSDQCPAEALPRNKARWISGMLGSSHCCYGNTSVGGGHAFGPPSIEEGGPRRTRRLRLGLSQNTERPCSNTCKGFRLHEILPPDVLRHSRSQAVVRTAEGEVNILSCCLFANTLRFSNERFSCFKLFRSR